MKRLQQIARRVLTLAIVAGVVAGAWFGARSEAAARALGKREDTRLVADQERPRYASAQVQETATVIVPNNSSTAQVVTAVEVDGAGTTAKVDVSRGLTGVGTNQDDVDQDAQPLELVSRSIHTADAVFTAGPTETDPWQRQAGSGPYRKGTYLDRYLVPVMNDVIGLELATLPWRDPEAVAEAAGGQTPAVPMIVPKDLPSEVTDRRRWTFDLATFRSVSPVAFAKTPFGGLAPTTQADVTMGFDDAGVLRYLLVTVDPLAAEPGEDGTQVFSYEWRVVGLSDDPATIVVPTEFVDAAPAG